MPAQVQMTSFAKQFGQRTAAANDASREVPASLGGQQRVPPGVKNGLAKLQVMTTSAYKDNKNGPNTEGKPFFRVSVVAVSPEWTDKGQRVAGIQMTKIIPLCDLPEKGFQKATTYEEGFAEMTAFIRVFGIAHCPETKQSDPSGYKVEAYWFAAMQTLCDPRKPRYIKFSTRLWTPNRPLGWKEGDSEPEARTIENWEGVASDEEVARLNGSYNPAAGASDAPTIPRQFTSPDGLPVNPTNSQVHSMSPETQLSTESLSLEDEVTQLIAIAMDDPEGTTEEGQAAQLRLMEMAQAGGWSEDQITAANWEEVGDMALNPSGEPENMEPVAIGRKFRFCKRTKEGTKAKSTKGEEFPPMEVEVVTVDTQNKTCTVKTIKDNKPITDIKTRQPVVVKFEWLE